jgi:hypothetical protein
MAYGKKLCFIVNVSTGTKIHCVFGKIEHLCNFATLVYGVTTGVLQLSHSSFIKVIFFPYYVVH